MSDVLRDGASRKLVWGADSSGNYRARDYFEGLDDKERAKFEPLFNALAETGKITNRERFTKEPNDIWCFKTHGRRLACFFLGRVVVLIHGFGKKTDRSRRSRRELETAAKLRRAYLDEHAKEV
jgi:phage-related protein